MTGISDPDPNAAALREALDAARRDDAALHRAAERLEGDRLGEQTNLLGVALDLAESGVDIAVTLRDGRLLHGIVDLVGADFMVLRMGVGARVVVPRSAITSFRSPGRPVAGTRSPSVSTTFHGFLSDLLVERSDVRLRLLGNDAPFGGELMHVGVDTFVVFTSGQPGTSATIPFDGLAELVLVG